MIAVLLRARGGSGFVRKATSALTYVAVVALATFHAWLLAAHIAGGQVFEPVVAFRWFAGALILAGFVALRRLGVPLLWGRRAVVLWLFVVLLHWHAIASPTTLATDMSAAIPEAVTALVAPAVFGPLLAGLGSLLVVRVAGRHAARSRAPEFCRISPAPWGGLRSGFIPQFSNRPPPL